MYFLSVSKGLQKKRKKNKTSTGTFPLIQQIDTIYSQGEASFPPFSVCKKEVSAAVVGQGITVDLEWTHPKCPKQINSIETSAAVLLEFHIKT